MKRNCVLITMMLLVFTCSSLLAANPPRFNQTFRVTTHNSYWVKRSGPDEAFATGAQENILDQLLFENVRGLEIDIKRNWQKRGSWKVYHTDRETNSICNPLEDCLKSLRQFHHLVPQHEAVVIVLELKQLFSKNFKKHYRPADLDNILERELGPYLFRPRDFMQHCPNAKTLRECARVSGHPTTHELRGKFIFTVLGNWRWCRIGNGAGGWADYATADNDIRQRSAFPHETDWGNFTKESCGNEYIPEEKVNLARANSLFLQVENLDDPQHLKEVAELVKQGVVVRAKDAFTHEEQEHRVSLGFHIIQTDYPWIQIQDHGQRVPLRPLNHVSVEHEEDFFEPGSKILFKKKDDDVQGSIAYLKNVSRHGQKVFSLISMPSTTRPSPNANFFNSGRTRGKGCLLLSSSRQKISERDVIELCRQTTEDGREHSVITLEGRYKGKEFYQRYHSIGDILQVSVHQGEAVFSVADNVSLAGQFQWRELGKVAMPDYHVGLSSYYGDVMFVGNRTGQGYLTGADIELPAAAGHDLIDQSWPLR